MSDGRAYRRAGRKPRSRLPSTLDPRQSFLIVCEGEKTEPNYFKKYRAPKTIIELVGVGDNTVTVVEKAIELRDKAVKKRDGFDQIWCVFDRDSFPARNFNKALKLAESEGIKTAYSNESFELWYLLHFQYVDSAIARNFYIVKLKGHLGRYEKNDTEMFDKLLPYRATAIRNALTLLSRYDPPRPERDNPSTTVHLLVQELLKNSPGSTGIT